MLKNKFSITSVRLIVITCLVIIAAILALSFNILALTPSDVNENLKVNKNKLSDLDKVYVQRVIDGDTFETAGGVDVRLIGVDTPETKHPDKGVEYYGREASKYTSRHLEGKSVYLEYDVEKRDKYQRILAYVFIEDGTFFNAKLLRDGYAELLTIPPNVKYVDLLESQVKEARNNNRGLWNKTETEKDEDLPVISWEDAADYIGQKVIVKGKIVDTYDSGKALFLNFDENHSDTFTAVIFKSDEYKFDVVPEDYYLNKTVKVKGKVKVYKGAPEIIVEEPDQIYKVK